MGLIFSQKKSDKNVRLFYSAGLGIFFVFFFVWFISTPNRTLLTKQEPGKNVQKFFSSHGPWIYGFIFLKSEMDANNKKRRGQEILFFPRTQRNEPELLLEARASVNKLFK